MTYAEKVKETINQLITRLKEISSLNNRVYKGYYTEHKEYPVLLVHLYEDTPIEETITQRRHHIRVHLLLKVRGNLGGDAESQMESFIDEVGYVIDKLDEYMANPPYWDLVRIHRVNYTFKQERQVIFYNALIDIELTRMW